MENVQENTVVHTEQNAPVTDSANPVDSDTATASKSEVQSTPNVEVRDGKVYIDGVRTYTRDDVNRIGATAKREAETRILSELNVDSLDAVKGVVQTLQETTPEAEGLNVASLRDAVKKREATVEELQSTVQSLRTELLLKDHMGQLQNAMPGSWTPEQRNAVIKLMKADGMLAVEGDTFAIRAGDDYLTTDGETPDYARAVEVVGKSIGLNFGKRGVDIQYGETVADSASSSKNKPLDDARVNTDAEYRAAYLQIRKYQPQLPRDQITDALVKKQIEKRKTSF